MAKKTSKGLVTYAKAQLGHPYWYGCFGQISSTVLYSSKKKQYPQQYTWKCKNNQPNTEPKKQLGVRVYDCIGLIKGYLWSDSIDGRPNYNPAQDVSANGMRDKCKKKGAIKTIPEVPGVLVFLPGHVGVYIGGGEVIEAKGHKWGVVKTKLKDRPWVSWGYCPWIDYGNVESEKPAAQKQQAVKVKEGIDTSKWNHVDFKSLNPEKVKADFVILRAGYCRYISKYTVKTDEYFKADIKVFNKRGIPCGVYWFAQEITTSEAKKSAQYLAKLLKKFTVSLPVYYDTEKSTAPEGTTGRADGLSKKLRTDVVIAFCDEIKRLGYKPGVYAGNSWYTDKLELNRLKGRGYSFWVARYGRPDDGKPHNKPSIEPCDIWQYTSHGHAAGVTGYVDLNYMYNDVTKPAGSGKTSEPVKVKYFPKYTGTSGSIVDALNALHFDSSFSYRKKIAAANNIKAYIGTAGQNKKILALLKQGKLVKP